MKTIGKFLKETRVAKKYSLSALEDATKIRKSFIAAIERQNWSLLPEFPVVVGFVKNIAKYLGVDERNAVALLRRDYPPKALYINPKPDVGAKFLWSPRLTFLVGITVTLIFILGYLVFQYSKFISAPSLSVSEPKEGQIVKTASVKVSGKTDPEATVKANNQPILVNEDGTFEAQIQIFEGTKEIIIKASLRSGKETTIKRKIVPELEK